jgi:hypothetical protein
MPDRKWKKMAKVRVKMPVTQTGFLTFGLTLPLIRLPNLYLYPDVDFMVLDRRGVSE